MGAGLATELDVSGRPINEGSGAASSCVLFVDKAHTRVATFVSFRAKPKPKLLQQTPEAKHLGGQIQDPYLLLGGPTATSLSQLTMTLGIEA